jgi:hypothetical protein
LVLGAVLLYLSGYVRADAGRAAVGRIAAEVDARDGLVLTDRDWAVIVPADPFQLCVEAADAAGGATVRASGGTTS